MQQKIRAAIAEHDLFVEHDRVLVAVSGGPDSLSLLHWLVHFGHEWQLKLMVAHLNHQLRGAEAQQDQVYVEKLCREWGVDCVSKSVDVASYAQRHKLSKQVASRECRYQFFEDVARQYSLSKLALAHHADDQLETVFMRLIRGAGLSGLSGIPIYRRTAHYMIVRPFLTLTKEEIEAYCAQHQLEPRRDASNESDQYTRNYIRHHLIPHALQLNPNVHQIVTEMTAILHTENQYLENESKRYLEYVLIEQSEEMITISRSAFLEVPLPLQSRLILLLLSYLPISSAKWSKIHIDSILHLLKTADGWKRIYLPEGILVSKEYDQVQLQSVPLEEDSQAYLEELPFQGDYELAYPHLKVNITTAKRKDVANFSLQPVIEEKKQCFVAVFDAQVLTLPLQLRSRLPGDRLKPLGMQGHKKLKDIFIDEKIPQRARQKWPLITAGEEIIWIPGLRRSNLAQVTEETEDILKIEVHMYEGDLIRARGSARNNNH